MSKYVVFLLGSEQKVSDGAGKNTLVKVHRELSASGVVDSDKLLILDGVETILRQTLAKKLMEGKRVAVLRTMGAEVVRPFETKGTVEILNISIVGHSRGAATALLLAKDLAEARGKESGGHPPHVFVSLLLVDPVSRSYQSALMTQAAFVVWSCWTVYMKHASWFFPPVIHGYLDVQKHRKELWQPGGHSDLIKGSMGQRTIGENLVKYFLTCCAGLKLQVDWEGVAVAYHDLWLKHGGGAGLWRRRLFEGRKHGVCSPYVANEFHLTSLKNTCQAVAQFMDCPTSQHKYQDARTVHRSNASTSLANLALDAAYQLHKKAMC